MRRRRQWLLLALALWAGGFLLSAQEPSPSGSSGAGTPSGIPPSGLPSAPAASSFGLPDPTTGIPAPSTVTPATPTAPSSPFATPEGTAVPSVPATQTEAPTTFNVPGLYGQSGQTFVAGQGRLARPRYRTNGSITFGLDDNVQATPFDAEPVPAVTQEVVTEAAVPERRFIIIIPPSGRGSFFGQRPRRQLVVLAAQPEKTQTVVLQPEIPAADRIFSAVARASVGFEMQMATRRTVFTMDVNASASFYTNRPGDKSDYNGSLSFAFLRKITPRLQFSATANLAYLSQPDISRVNTPLNQVGDYFNGTVKMDLSYRWTKRFSTVSSLSIDTTQYSVGLQESSSFYEVTVGTEARYLYSPRLTLLVEGRYSFTTYPSDPARDSNSIFALLGAEMVLTRRINASVRFGLSQRDFQEQSEVRFGPYAETTLAWRYQPSGVLSWTTRFGFEEPPDAISTVQVFRTSISVLQAFSARLKATGSLSAAHRITERDGADELQSDSSFSLDLGMEYTLSRHTTLTGNYSFTGNLSTIENTSYFRNQIFFGLRYAY